MDFEEECSAEESEREECGNQSDNQGDNQSDNYSTTDDKVFHVNTDALEDEERKLSATLTLRCFAALRNKWSTNDELGLICNILYPSSRGGGVTIHDHKRNWRGIAKKFGYGHDHENEPADGCECEGLHRYCERKITKENDKGKQELVRQEARIHPAFAKEVFSPGDITVDQLEAIPTRNLKKRVTHEKPAEGSLEHELNESLKKRRRLLTRIRNKLGEIDKVREEMSENETHVTALREEYLKQEAKYRLEKKGRRMDNEDEHERKTKKPKTSRPITKETKRVEKSDSSDDAEGEFESDAEHF